MYATSPSECFVNCTGKKRASFQIQVVPCGEFTKMSSGAKQKDSKKSGHYVPSRYMQAADKVSTQSNVSKEKSFLVKSRRDISGNLSQDTKSSSKLNTSEDCRGMTSTPTSKGEFPLLQLDASAVTGSDGYLTVPHSKGRIGPLSSDFVRGNLTKKYKSRNNETHQSQHPVIVSYKEKKKNDNYNEKLAEAQIDILYASYLQAAFLESEAKKVLEARSSRVIETLHKLFNLVLQHLYKLKSQNCALKILSSLIEVHEHCQKQEEILKPVFEIIPILEEQYKSLAEAINSTKHKLHVKDVILPSAGSEGDIDDALRKMSSFICGFLKLLPNYKDIITSSNDLKNYADAGELINEALKRGLSLLVEATDLYFSEASLALGRENL